MKRIVITCGDINGIGPEIVAKALGYLSKRSKLKIYLLSPVNIFEDSLRFAKDSFSYETVQKYSDADHHNYNTVSVISLGKVKKKIGVATRVSGLTSFEAIEKSYQFVSTGLADAVVTAPISKSSLALAGIDFPGHTEMYASWCKVKNFSMMFVSNKMKASIFTIHNPVKDISKRITSDRIINSLKTINSALQNDFMIKKPKIALLGLNPHAGEGGRIGREEIDVIIPAIKKISPLMNIEGPFPADGFFASKSYKSYDIVIGMYHDQILIPFKLLNFGGGVNYTAGLPIVRTSPDHGTAFNIAWQGKADESSFIEAFKLALKIVDNRKKSNSDKNQ